jgi:hypothetical protein
VTEPRAVRRLLAPRLTFGSAASQLLLGERLSGVFIADSSPCSGRRPRELGADSLMPGGACDG